MQRKQFLKMSLLANAGLLVNRFTPGALISGRQTGTGPDNVIFYSRGAAPYESLRKGFNKRIQRFPRVIALCKNSDGIVEALQYARKEGLAVAVKSGGHCLEGFSSNDDGLVVNLSLLDDISWIDENTFRVGPACTLSKIYDFTLRKNKVVPGGSCGSVGIGGLTMGGGYGLLSREFGLTCDALTDVMMVDGNGIKRNARDENGLLWACRGGGTGNFGVVSELNFAVKESPAGMQSFRFSSYKVNAERAVSVLQQWFSFTRDLPPYCFSSFLLNEATIYILITATRAAVPELGAVLSELARCTVKKTHTRFRPLAHALKAYYGVTHPIKFKNACAGLYRRYGDLQPVINRVFQKIIASSGTIFQINTLGGEIQNREAAENSCFPHRSYNYIAELQTYWDKDPDGLQQMEQFQQIQLVLAELDLEAQYCNYPDINFKNYPSLYYGRNYRQLQEVKNRYDPLNLIRHDQSIQNP